MAKCRYVKYSGQKLVYTVHTLDMCVVIRTFDMYTKRRQLFIIAIRTSVTILRVENRSTSDKHKEDNKSKIKTYVEWLQNSSVL